MCFVNLSLVHEHTPSLLQQQHQAAVRLHLANICFSKNVIRQICCTRCIHFLYDVVTNITTTIILTVCMRATKNNTKNVLSLLFVQLALIVAVCLHCCWMGQTRRCTHTHTRLICWYMVIHMCDGYYASDVCVLIYTLLPHLLIFAIKPVEFAAANSNMLNICVYRLYWKIQRKITTFHCNCCWNFN